METTTERSQEYITVAEHEAAIADLKSQVSEISQLLSQLSFGVSLWRNMQAEMLKTLQRKMEEMGTVRLAMDSAIVKILNIDGDLVSHIATEYENKITEQLKGRDDKVDRQIKEIMDKFQGLDFEGMTAEEIVEKAKGMAKDVADRDSVRSLASDLESLFGDLFTKDTNTDDSKNS